MPCPYSAQAEFVLVLPRVHSPTILEQRTDKPGKEAHLDRRERDRDRERPARVGKAVGLDLADAVLAGLGAIVGGGVFVAPGLAAEMAGPALLLALVLSGIVAMISGQAVASTAGSDPAVRVQPFARYAANWLGLCAMVLAAAAVAGTFTAYLLPAEQATGEAVSRAIAAGLVVALTVLLLSGVRIPLRVSGAAAAVALCALAFLVGLAVPQMSRANFVPFAPKGFAGVWRAAALLSFLYAGFGRLTSHAALVENARRTVPRATLISLLVAMIVYVAVGAGALGVGGMMFTGHDLAGRAYNAPLLIGAAFTAMPAAARWIVTAGALLAAISILLTLLDEAARTAATMAGNRDLPPLFAALLPGPKVAWAPLLLAGAVAAVLSASISVPALLAASAFTALFGWTVANAEALLAARGDALRLILHGVGFLACAGLALSLPGGAIRSGLVLVFAGVIVYLLRPFWK